MSTGEGRGYIPALDGVRGLAITLVVLSHSVRHTGGGGLGVQIFFTLSGFLITLLLLNEWERRGEVSYRNFYVRRVLRLYPALLLAVLLVALLPNVYIDPKLDGTTDSRWLIIPLTLVYVSNYANALGVYMGYLAHAWSLAIEEQFYLVWPVVAIWLVRRRLFGRVVPALIVGFALLRVVMQLAGVPAVSSWLPAQADQLLMGALLAYALQQGLALPAWISSRWAGWLALGVLALLAVVGSFAELGGMQGPFAFYGGLVVCAIAATVLIGNLVTTTSPLVRLFSWAPAVAVGRVSYGIYLFHFPIFQYVAHQRWGSMQTYVVEYGVTAVVVLFSWFVVERPALRLKRRFESPTAGSPAAAQGRS